MAEAPARKQIQNTIYDQMAFPDYEFREFPMAVPVKDGVVQKSPYDENKRPHEVVIVRDQDELDALMGPDVELIPIDPNALNSPHRVKSDADLRVELMTQVDQLKVPGVDGRWGNDRIEKAIRDFVAAKSKPAEIV